MTWRKACSDIHPGVPVIHGAGYSADRHPGAFLVRRRDQSERSPKSKNETNELAHRGHSRGSHLQTSIAEDQLQQRRVHQLRRKLSEHFSGLAVLLGWLGEMKFLNSGARPANCKLNARIARAVCADHKRKTPHDPGGNSGNGEAYRLSFRRLC